MRKINITAFIALLILVTVNLYAEDAVKGKEPVVIDTLSEEYQKNITAPLPTNDLTSTATRKITYISAFAENSTDTNDSAKQNISADISQEDPKESLEDLRESYKVLKSNVTK